MPARGVRAMLPGVPLDPQLRPVVDAIRQVAEAVSIWDQTPDEYRLAYQALGALGSRPEGVEVEELTVAGAEGDLAARIYRPGDTGGSRPGLVYFHGGGYVIGDLDSHDSACAVLAASSGATLVAVDYRRCPEHPVFAPLQDSVAAFADVAGRASELGVDPARLGVGGDSAGGNLALNVSLAARREGRPAPVALLLVYPWLDMDLGQPSVDEHATGYVLTRDVIRWFRHHALPAELRDDPSRWDDERLSPARSDPSGFPPAVVATCELDPLRDQGDAFALRLAEAGVAVRHLRYDGLVHTFVQLTDASEHAREATEEIGRELGALLAA